MAFPSGFAHTSRRRTRTAGSGEAGRAGGGEGLAAREEAELRGPAAHTTSPPRCERRSLRSRLRIPPARPLERRPDTSARGLPPQPAAGGLGGGRPPVSRPPFPGASGRLSPAGRALGPGVADGHAACPSREEAPERGLPDGGRHRLPGVLRAPPVPVRQHRRGRPADPRPGPARPLHALRCRPALSARRFLGLCRVRG